MVDVSQRTVVGMIEMFRELGCYDPSGYSFSSQAPKMTATRLREFLYSHNFEKKFLDQCEDWDWSFERILPSLRDESFFVVGNQNFRTKVQSAYNNQGRGQTLLRMLLATVVEIYMRLKMNRTDEFVSILHCMDADGLIWAEGKILDADREIVDIPAELSAFEKTMQSSGHDDLPLLQHHFSTAQRQFNDSEWGPSAGEWRKLFEEIMRGVWRMTRQKNPAFSGYIEHPNFADVMNWLFAAGFFHKDEKDAYGAAWGFLSVGNHPGMLDAEVAKFSRILSLTFGHSCLQKLEWWKKKGYR
jgi:hypothetical protein